MQWLAYLYVSVIRSSFLQPEACYACFANDFGLFQVQRVV